MRSIIGRVELLEKWGIQGVKGPQFGFGRSGGALIPDELGRATDWVAEKVQHGAGYVAEKGKKAYEKTKAFLFPGESWSDYAKRRGEPIKRVMTRGADIGRGLGDSAKRGVEKLKGMGGSALKYGAGGASLVALGGLTALGSSAVADPYAESDGSCGMKRQLMESLRREAL